MLQIKNLSAGYNNVNVLRDISFTLMPGEKLAVIGPNGCGKTTLLRAVANLIPSSGEITLDGRALRQMPRKKLARKIAMLSQITQVYFSYSVYETVMMGRYTYRRALASPDTADKAAVDSALGTVHMLDYANRDITSLSGGQLQRVFLAKILAQEPDIILLDEPTNHLDLAYQAELIEYLNLWSQTNARGVIGVLHDINLAMNFADTVLLLKEGKAVSYGKATLNADVLKSVYGMDVAAFMRQSLNRWNKIL